MKGSGAEVEGAAAPRRILWRLATLRKRAAARGLGTVGSIIAIFLVIVYYVATRDSPATGGTILGAVASAACAFVLILMLVDPRARQRALGPGAFPTRPVLEALFVEWYGAVVADGLWPSDMPLRLVVLVPRKWFEEEWVDPLVVISQPRHDGEDEAPERLPFAGCLAGGAMRDGESVWVDLRECEVFLRDIGLSEDAIAHVLRLQLQQKLMVPLWNEPGVDVAGVMSVETSRDPSDGSLQDDVLLKRIGSLALAINVVVGAAFGWELVRPQHSRIDWAALFSLAASGVWAPTAPNGTSEGRANS